MPTPNHEPLILTTPDSQGNVPDRNIVGHRFVHTQTGMIVVIKRWSFDAERNRWLIVYKEQDLASQIEFAHLPEDFFRQKDDGKRRYEPAP